MEFRSSLSEPLADKIEDCRLAAKDTMELCGEFERELFKVTSILREVERLLRQKVDTIGNNSYEVVNRSHRLIDNLLTELESNVATNRDSTIREEGQTGR